MTRSLDRYKTFLAGALAGFLVLSAAARGAEVRLSETRTESENLVVMENEFVRMNIDMLHGAKVTGFRYKPPGREWVASGQGLFIDHVWQQTWPGELYDAKYDYEVLERGPARASVRAWRSLQREGMEGIIGVRVERTLSLSAGSPMVTADVALVNPTDRVKTVGYWSQHIFRLGGMGDNFYIRPSADGLAVATFEYRDEGRVRDRVGAEWVKQPVAGWTAALNPTTGEAAVFLMDYNDLRWLYNCIGHHTTEWYYDLLRMAPGTRWETRLSLLPLRGYRGVSFASREVVADLRLMRCEEGFRPVYAVGCGESPLDRVTLKGEVVTAAGGRALGSDSLAIERLGYLPEELVSAVTVPRAGEPFLVNVRIEGPGFAHEFEKHFGDYNRSDRLVAGVFDTGYSIRPPEKQKALPDRPARIRKLPHEGMAVYEARGQFYPAWRLEEALKRQGQYSLKGGHFSSNVYGEQLDYFPAGYGEIMALDVVVLNNVPAGALGANDLALLEDYVRHGGGLLVLGGWYAFGGGRYADSALSEMLPVQSGRPFDIRWHRDGLPLGPGAGVLFSGIDLSEGPLVLWHQEVPRVKENAQVALRAGEEPFVVVWQHGQGRVACVLASPTGVPPAGGKLFCEWDRWPAMLGTLLRWLNGEAPG